MFDMENVGRKIAEMRKSHNMTQLELQIKWVSVFRQSQIGSVEIRCPIFLSCRSWKNCLDNVINDIVRKMINESKNIEDIAPFVNRDIIVVPISQIACYNK